MTEKLQMLWLFVLAAPVACVAWTVTHEEVFREFHEWCVKRSRTAHTIAARKFFYLFTCEYCFSHYVAGTAVVLTGYRLLLPDWRGAILGWFTLVWIANIYMSLFGRLRLDIKRERVEIKAEELEVEREAAAAKPAPSGRAPRSLAEAPPPTRQARRV
jgi:hypothetical protein